jgi:hypothetical protein
VRHGGAFAVVVASGGDRDSRQAEWLLCEEAELNWLTLRLAALDGFGPLHERAAPVAESTLRRVPLGAVEQSLRVAGAAVDVAPVFPAVSEAYLFTEDRDGARMRRARAQDVPGGAERPAWYTVGLVDADGLVLYLPDDALDEPDIQLFVGADDGPLSRLHITGEFLPEYAHLTEARLAEPDVCADGPCRESVPDPCSGDGCECQEFLEEAQVVRDRLRNALGGRGDRHDAWVGRCHRWPPAT